MTEPEHTPAWMTPEPGAIIFINDPFATGFTDDEVTALLTGQPIAPIKVGESAALTAGQVFHLPGMHDQRTHGMKASQDIYEHRLNTAHTGFDAQRSATIHVEQERTPTGGSTLSTTILDTPGDALHDRDGNPVTRGEARAAIRDYGGSGHKETNRRLRDDESFSSDKTRGMDAAMQESTLDHDVVVYRGIPHVSEVIPGTERGQNLTGTVFRDRAFVSTSIRENPASNFSRVHTDQLDNAYMRILVPRGTRAVSARELDMDELVLDRGLSFRVIADHGRATGLGDFGPRLLDVEVIPAGGTQ